MGVDLDGNLFVTIFTREMDALSRGSVRICGIDFGISTTICRRMLSNSLRVSKLSLGIEFYRNLLDILRETGMVSIPGIQSFYVRFGMIALLDLKVNSL